jgi:AcrR family transcriptional regulator
VPLAGGCGSIQGLADEAAWAVGTGSGRAHRRAVRDATLDTTVALVAEHGLASVTMSQIAEQTGIGRATLYKYFPDVEAILLAWHQRQVAEHLEQLPRSETTPVTLASGSRRSWRPTR